MSLHERPLGISSPDGQVMLGIVSLPPPGVLPSGIGILIVVGGAQYRVGSHRQFVALARRLAAAGHTVLRFDFPGMGDSPGEPIAFENSQQHLACALTALQQQLPPPSRLVLWGLCDGASASLLYLQAQPDARLAGLVLLNPWVRSPASLAQAQVRHYYRNRLLQAHFWRKLLQGRIGWSALRELTTHLRQIRRPLHQSTHFSTRMAQGLAAHSGPVLLLLSEHDLTAQEFADQTNTQDLWRLPLSQAHVTRCLIAGADHTLSTGGTQNEMETTVLNWLAKLPPADHESPGSI